MKHIIDPATGLCEICQRHEINAIKNQPKAPKKAAPNFYRVSADDNDFDDVYHQPPLQSQIPTETRRTTTTTIQQQQHHPSLQTQIPAETRRTNITTIQQQQHQPSLQSQMPTETRRTNITTIQQQQHPPPPVVKVQTIRNPNATETKRTTTIQEHPTDPNQKPTETVQVHTIQHPNAIETITVTETKLPPVRYTETITTETLRSSNNTPPQIQITRPTPPHSSTSKTTTTLYNTSQEPNNYVINVPEQPPSTPFIIEQPLETQTETVVLNPSNLQPKPKTFNIFRRERTREEPIVVTTPPSPPLVIRTPEPTYNDTRIYTQRDETPPQNVIIRVPSAQPSTKRVIIRQPEPVQPTTTYIREPPVVQPPTIIQVQKPRTPPTRIIQVREQTPPTRTIIERPDTSTRTTIIDDRAMVDRRDQVIIDDRRQLVNSNYDEYYYNNRRGRTTNMCGDCGNCDCFGDCFRSCGNCCKMNSFSRRKDVVSYKTRITKDGRRVRYRNADVPGYRCCNCCTGWCARFCPCLSCLEWFCACPCWLWLCCLLPLLLGLLGLSIGLLTQLPSINSNKVQYNDIYVTQSYNAVYAVLGQNAICQPDRNFPGTPLYCDQTTTRLLLTATASSSTVSAMIKDRRILYALGTSALLGVVCAVWYRMRRKGLSSHFVSSDHLVLEIQVPHYCVGGFIGKSGENIKKFQQQFSVRCVFVKDEKNLTEQEQKNNNNTTNKYRTLVIRGHRNNVYEAEVEIRRMIADMPEYKEIELFIPEKSCGYIIGKGGACIREIRETTGARLNFDKKIIDNLENTVYNRLVIYGTNDQITTAKTLIEARLEELKEKQKQKEAKSNSEQKTLETVMNDTSPIHINNDCCFQSLSELKYKQMLFDENEIMVDIYVSSVVNPNSFSVQRISTINQLDELNKRMSDYYHNSTCDEDMINIDELKPGLCVAALFEKHDQKWYRGIVHRIENNTIDVEFVDYGDGDDMEITVLRKLKPEFFDLPIQAVECSLQDIIPSDNTSNNDDTYSEEAIGWFSKQCHVAERTIKLEMLIIRRDHDNIRNRTKYYVCLMDRNQEQSINFGLELVDRKYAALQQPDGWNIKQ
ncbi:unnamed protein product [Didymodactylos carnosus]|uniref:Tudor domain-containing protein n=1 Tax=Didymodactylos carnosus TaxID=1234261 RepID=A0A813SEJ1_9BILA|nr:unnamed protein product [Didymodactylos carnosus]CAF3580117.1 unnamed protein product [Didymodactylos carnosus]